MKLNWGERLAVNNPIRPLEQWFEIQWMKKKRPLRPGARILEIGCGRGAGARIILEVFQPARFHALDLDTEMIRKARNHLPWYRGKETAFFVADATHLPYPDGIWDVVFGFGVLHHVPDWRRALKEIARILKAEGVYFLEEIYPSLYQNALTKHILLHPREDRFRSQELREALKDTHLSLTDSLEHRGLGILGVAIKTSDLVVS